MTRPARRLAALLALTAVLVGLPVALWVVGGAPWSGLGSAGDAADSLLRPADGSLVLAVVKLAAWLAWASVAAALLVEGYGRARGITAPQLPGLRPQQRLAAVLLSAVLVGAAPVAAHAASLPVRQPVATGAPPVAASRASELSGPVTEAFTALAPVSRAVTVTSPAAVTVSEGDTLWRLAESQLGDGMRWRELAAANYGRPQADGGALDTSHVLQPGWSLVLPDTQSAPPPPEEAHARVVIEGDTLSGIAAAELGDGSRYPELAAATATIVQPDGRQLSDPDLIYPGWTVAIPTVTSPSGTPAEPEGSAAPAPAPAEAAEAPAPAAEAPGPAAEATQAPSATAVPQPQVEDRPPAAASLTAGDDGDHLDQATENPVDMRTATGIGALLAAAVLAVLAIRRGRQRAHRRPGRRIPLPVAVATQQVEAQLREVAGAAQPELLAAALADLAAACRVNGLALPRLRAARLEFAAVELYLSLPAQLPAPWRPVGDDATIWARQLPSHPAASADPRDPLDGDEPPGDVGAPYPTLVTLGQDSPTSHLLVDLDELSVFGISGADGASRASQSAIAAELATNSWSTDVLVTVVGTDRTLADAFPTGRVRTVEAHRLLPDLRDRAAATGGAVEAAGTDRLAQARQSGGATAGGDGPAIGEYEVVLVRSPLPSAVERELVELAGPQHGISVVLARENDSPAPQSTPLEETAMWILDHRPSEPDEPPLAVLNPVGVPLIPQTLGVDALHALLDAMAHTSRPAVLPPVFAPPVGHPAPAVRPAPAAPATLGSQPVPSVRPAAESTAPAPLVAPRLRLLGPVVLEGATGPEPGTHTARTIALLAVLATHRQGRTRDQLAEALSPNHRLAEATLHALVSRARRWLGTATDGRSYLPRTVATGAAAYRLDPDIATDWDAWRSLVGPEPVRTPPERLLDALDLVRDTPFAGVVERHYTWSEPLREEMVASIVDVAHIVAGRAMERRDWAMARQAVQAGRRADPMAEVLWRDALKVESAAGAHGTVATLVNHIQNWSDDSGLDLDPATEALVVQLGTDPVSRIAVPDRAPAVGGLA